MVIWLKFKDMIFGNGSLIFLVCRGIMNLDFDLLVVLLDFCWKGLWGYVCWGYMRVVIFFFVVMFVGDRE